MTQFALIVPLKSSTRGKSRILLPVERRRALALAMAYDTVQAAVSTAGVRRVLVVVEEAADAARFASLGAELIVNAAPGLNEAITSAARQLARDGWSGPVAVIPADLPFLQGLDLGAALLAGAVRRRAVVADLAGTGTTLLTASEPGGLRPRFGTWSFGAHQRAGAIALPVPVSSTLRWDVDTIADLHRTGTESALGPHSRAVLDTQWPQRFGISPVLP